MNYDKILSQFTQVLSQFEKPIAYISGVLAAVSNLHLNILGSITLPIWLQILMPFLDAGLKAAIGAAAVHFATRFLSKKYPIKNKKNNHEK